MTDDALLRLARRFAEEVHMAALTRFMTRPDIIAKRRARIAAIRAHNADCSPEVLAALEALRFAANGGLTDSCCKPSVTTRGAGGEADGAAQVKPESDADPPP